MRDPFGSDALVGYCTNVHAGATWEQSQANLHRYAPEVKAQASPDAPMGVGLWFSAQSARELIQNGAVAELRDWLGENELIASSFNGFPYGDFHEPIVKHKVYEPNWRDPARVAYTRDLVEVMCALLGEGEEGSISTLPLGWKPHVTESGSLAAAVEHLLGITNHLEQVEAQTGKLIHLDLEPEPGCYLERAEDVVALFEGHLLPRGDEKRVRRYLRVCHDICHAAVMFEDQSEVLGRYRASGIRVGKVQISSALQVCFDRLGAHLHERSLARLRQFQEDRYLHQTTVRTEDGSVAFHDDLPQAIAAQSGGRGPCGEWRVHFHVPIFLRDVGAIDTTQDHIRSFMHALRPEDRVRHFEVETYAWNVLPERPNSDDLAAGIAQELTWLQSQFCQGPCG